MPNRTEAGLIQKEAGSGWGMTLPVVISQSKTIQDSCHSKTIQDGDTCGLNDSGAGPQHVSDKQPNGQTAFFPPMKVSHGEPVRRRPLPDLIPICQALGTVTSPLVPLGIPSWIPKHSMTSQRLEYPPINGKIPYHGVNGSVSLNTTPITIAQKNICGAATYSIPRYIRGPMPFQRGPGVVMPPQNGSRFVPYIRGPIQGPPGVPPMPFPRPPHGAYTFARPAVHAVHQEGQFPIPDPISSRTSPPPYPTHTGPSAAHRLSSMAISVPYNKEKLVERYPGQSLMY